MWPETNLCCFKEGRRSHPTNRFALTSTDKLQESKTLLTLALPLLYDPTVHWARSSKIDSEAHLEMLVSSAVRRALLAAPFRFINSRSFISELISPFSCKY
jgi:hypothetical protein